MFKNKKDLIIRANHFGGIIFLVLLLFFVAILCTYLYFITNEAGILGLASISIALALDFLWSSTYRLAIKDGILTFQHLFFKKSIVVDDIVKVIYFEKEVWYVRGVLYSPPALFLRLYDQKIYADTPLLVMAAFFSRKEMKKLNTLLPNAESAYKNL